MSREQISLLTTPGNSSPVWPRAYRHILPGPILLNTPVIDRVPQGSRTPPMPQAPVMPQTTLMDETPLLPPAAFVYSPCLAPISAQANVNLDDGNKVARHDVTTQEHRTSQNHPSGTCCGSNRPAPVDRGTFPFSLSPLDETLRTVVDYMLSHKTISEIKFQHLTSRVSPFEQEVIRLWAYALMADSAKQWSMYLFPDCRGKPFEGASMCGHSKYTVAKSPPSGSVVCRYYHDSDCPRHSSRLEEPPASEKVLLCALEWPECVGDDCGGPCVKVIDCAPSDDPPNHFRFWAFPGPCDEHRASCYRDQGGDWKMWEDEPE